jgi:hypothetical protein
MYPNFRTLAVLALAAGIALAQSGPVSAANFAQRYQGPTSIPAPAAKNAIPKICKNSISRSFEGYTAKKCA